MATHDLPIMGATVVPDSTGECYMDNINNQITLGTGSMRNLVMVLKDPSADTGFYGSFIVPQNYSSTPKVKVSYILDGTVGATNVGFGMSVLPRADGEAVDAAWEETNTFTKQSNDDADEDVVVVEDAFSTASFAAGEEVFYYFFRDFSADGFVGDVHVTGLYFNYADA